MLNGIAGLIASIAGLITAVTGLVGMLVVARRTSPKERVDAAAEAAERVLNPPSTNSAVNDTTALQQIRDAQPGRTDEPEC